MLADAHCHPFDLAGHFPGAEEQRKQLGAMCAASSATLEEFIYCEKLSPSLLTCCAVHPQMPLAKPGMGDDALGMVETLAMQGRLAAIGETGFDLYDAAFRETEKVQERLFEGHLDLALRYNLPLVIHARRAMHKVFAHSQKLKKCRAVVFHSWPGTAGEGGSLLKRGVNAFFSFGTPLLLNHREAMRCGAALPMGRLLTETDAPFQPLRGNAYSTYADLNQVLEALAALRGESRTEIERMVEGNFRRAFG